MVDLRLSCHDVTVGWQHRADSLNATCNCIVWLKISPSNLFSALEKRQKSVSLDCTNLYLVSQMSFECVERFEQTTYGRQTDHATEKCV